jgi:TRAP-type mannitol/chloroaromatic compound transport system permease small subunit
VNLLSSFVRAIDAANDLIGRVVMWLSLGIVLVCFAAVYLRYAVGTGMPWLQELYVWQHAIIFLIGAGFTLLHGGHVRVDLFYGIMSVRRRAMVDLAGTLFFLLPFVVVLAYEAVPLVVLSWQNNEVSVQPGGMPAIYVLKSMLHGFCLVVGLQGLAIAARSVLVLSGREEFAPGRVAH